MNNKDRVHRAGKAMIAYHNEHGDDDRETLLIDLLADLQHWCDAKGFDFSRASRIATQHHEAEKTPKGRVIPFVDGEPYEI